MENITGYAVAKTVSQWLEEDGLKGIKPQEVYNNWRKRNMGPQVDLETAEKEAQAFYLKKKDAKAKTEFSSLVSKPE